MRVSCPSCAAIYEVPTELLGAEPRKLRCARCGTEWTREAVAKAPIKTPAAPVVAPAVEFPRETVPRLPEIVPDKNDSPPEGDALMNEDAGEKRVPTLTSVPPRDAPPMLGAIEVPPPPEPEVKRFLRNGHNLGFRRHSTIALSLGWAASIVVIILLVWAGYSFRSGVMQAWPPSQRFYAALGLAPQPPQSSAPSH